MINKVLVLGSGAIKIGQAGEFDYSGSQAIKALKEENIEVVLINPNIATVQTGEKFADKVYFLPIEDDFVEKVIEKEKPDSIFLGFGGQSALNVGVSLYKKGILDKYNVEVLGTPIKSIEITEDRELFKKHLDGLGLKYPNSYAVDNLDDAIAAAEKIGFPVMVRVAFALGGLGSGVVANMEEFISMVKKAFASSKQILVEEYLEGWKEIEFEVVRDKDDNCITVCSMENFDPMGIHTGESIVVAPIQTLYAEEYFKLRSIAIKTIRSLGIVGECNIQYAYDVHSDDYRIIEVNARLSRSSALASKATGYPLAFVAAKLGLGYNLENIKNSVTKKTSAFFEPALDYVVVKFPRWDLQKFKRVSNVLGSEMKSVGEVMAIGRSFEEAIQKSIRMLDIGVAGLQSDVFDFDDIDNELQNPTDKRIFAIAKALKNGYSVDKICELTKINSWFINKINNIVSLEKYIENKTIEDLNFDILLELKRKGFSDKQIANLIDNNEIEVREKRKKLGIIPYVKQIDTLAGEVPANTNYLYMTYNASFHDISNNKRNQVIVLGGGPYRIGSSVEFDWCSVSSIFTLNELGYKSIIINCNPETVSTDYDIAHKLYFEELTYERVMDIYELEIPKGIIISMGGQTANNLAIPLSKSGVNILGTPAESVDRAEDRHKFSKMLDDLGIDQPEWQELSNLEAAKEFARRVGYPVLIRPSYVLSGAAMSIALNENELIEYLKKASDISSEHPVVISKFITGAKEIEVDAVAENGELKLYAISEHVENAGVHSGDATIVFPPQRLYFETIKRIRKITKKIASSLSITGPFNIQFIAKDNYIKVIECNLRASRSFPFVSKIAKINFIDVATKLMVGYNVGDINFSLFDIDFVGVKAPQFSFKRLKGSDPIIGVEMASTGEVGCIGDDFYEAFLKSLISVGYTIPKKAVLLSTGPLESKAMFLESSKLIQELGFKIYATCGTADFLKQNGIDVEILHWPLDKKEPNVLTYLTNGKIDLVINIPKNYEKEELDNDYIIRRTAVDYNVPLITNLQFGKRFIESIYFQKYKNLKIKNWQEYVM